MLKNKKQGLINDDIVEDYKASPILKNKKIIVLIILIIAILIAGTIMIIVKGLNYDLMYSKNTKIQAYIKSDFEIKDIKKIVNETFIGKRSYIQNINIVENMLIITVEQASDDEINTLIQKINEKYNIELTNDDLVINKDTNINMIDIINQYIAPIVITIAIILAYLLIRFKKIGLFKILLYTIASVVLSQCLYISIIAISRIPVNFMTIPVALLIFIINIYILALIFERKLAGEKVKK